MTKSELVAALTALPDDAKVLIRCVATDWDGCDPETLSYITSVNVFNGEPNSPAFAALVHKVY